MRTFIALSLLFAFVGVAVANAAVAAPEDGASAPAPAPAVRPGVVRTVAAPAPTAATRPDPRATRCRRDFGWYPWYRNRCAPAGAACRPVTWRAPYYRRVDHCRSWYGPRCYGRPFPSYRGRSAYYRSVMGP